MIALDAAGAPCLTTGTPGGHGILQTTAQMLSNAIDLGLNPQAAVESARVRVDEGHYVAFESRIPPAVTDELAARGHECHSVGDWMYAPQEGRTDIGRGSMAVRDPDSAMLFAGSDPRGDGLALGF
jgi:gamma-glutamyltranspeptidase/glutathione hydrolase